MEETEGHESLKTENMLLFSGHCVLKRCTAVSRAPVSGYMVSTLSSVPRVTPGGIQCLGGFVPAGEGVAESPTAIRGTFNRLWPDKLLPEHHIAYKVLFLQDQPPSRVGISTGATSLWRAWRVPLARPRHESRQPTPLRQCCAFFTFFPFSPFFPALCQI